LDKPPPDLTTSRHVSITEEGNLVLAKSRLSPDNKCPPMLVAVNNAGEFPKRVASCLEPIWTAWFDFNPHFPFTNPEIWCVITNSRIKSLWLVRRGNT